MDKQYYINNHIGLFKNFMSNEMIDDYINYFNKCEEQGAVYARKVDEMLVSDSSIDTIKDMNVSLTYVNKPFINMFFKLIEIPAVFKHHTEGNILFIDISLVA